MPSDRGDKTPPSRLTVRLRERASIRWGAPHRWKCVYCGAKATEVDHFFPKAIGHAADASFNLVPACSDCNRSKSDAWPQDWMEAAGVPEFQRKVLLAICCDPEWRKPRGFELPRNSLNRPKPGSAGQFQGS